MEIDEVEFAIVFTVYVFFTVVYVVFFLASIFVVKDLCTQELKRTLIDEIKEFDLDNEINQDCNEEENPIMLVDTMNSDNVHHDDILNEEPQQQTKVDDRDELTTTTTAFMHYINVKQGREPIRQNQQCILYHLQKDFVNVLKDMLKSRNNQENQSTSAPTLQCVSNIEETVRELVYFKLLNNVREIITNLLPTTEELFQRNVKKKKKKKKKKRAVYHRYVTSINISLPFLSFNIEH